MKLGMLAVAGLSMGLACAALAQSANDAAWVGVWQGELDGQPGVTLTLAEDTGELGGTVVLNMVSKQGGTAHVIGSVSHVLLHPELQGNVLTFEVKQARDGRVMRFSVTRTADGKAQIHCLSCGPGGPVAPLEKVQYGSLSVR